MTPPSRAYTAPLLLAVILLSGVMIVAAERTFPRWWEDRLLWPSAQQKIDRHTARWQATPLPQVLDSSYSWSSPLVQLSGQTLIPSEETVVIPAGTRVVAAEFSSLLVEGQLYISGTAERPVLFSSNEAHPANQTWAGIVVADSGLLSVSHATLEAASPGITCLPGAIADFNFLEVAHTSLGVLSQSADCIVAASRIVSFGTGIQYQGVPTPTENTNVVIAPRMIITID